MNYFDTDVLVHSVVYQNPNLHQKINELIDSTTDEGSFAISWLSIQETGFVLAKLGQDTSIIRSSLNLLMNVPPLEFSIDTYKRAIQLAEIIGFRDFNDCLHTAIAEQHCTDLYTCNYKDFKRIQPHTALNILFL